MVDGSGVDLDDGRRRNNSNNAGSCAPGYVFGLRRIRHVIGISPSLSGCLHSCERKLADVWGGGEVA